MLIEPPSCWLCGGKTTYKPVKILTCVSLLTETFEHISWAFIPHCERCGETSSDDMRGGYETAALEMAFNYWGVSPDLPRNKALCKQLGSYAPNTTAARTQFFRFI